MQSHQTASPRHVILALCSALVFLAGCGDGSDAGYPATAGDPSVAHSVFPLSHDPERLARIGPDACLECHADVVEDWKQSHHAHANRPVSIARDRAAFTPPRQVQEGGVTYELSEEDGKFLLRVLREDGSAETHELIGVIGETPIRQYLTVLPGNKIQTISASYDVLNDRWVDVFAGENRQPGEWGHWTGQGMNWNANCAYCHTTEYEKGFDLEGNAYHSTWVQQGLACASCHTGLEEHVEAARGEDYTTELIRLSRPKITESCASCHSRRDQLTSDDFVPGDHYHDHFNLSLPDQHGLYYPDGQILDEVFVYASLEMSRMGHAGVSCLDCHDPHTLEPIAPIENNLLCMRCHETGVMESPVIEPLEHSFHPAGSSGNSCVECHMPKTTYMQVDPRADHGFLHPDPLLTKELGIPNACNTCHTEESVDWAIEWSEKWYGEKLAESPQRRRARVIAAAYELDPEALDPLMELLESETIPAWRATYAGLLADYLPHNAAERSLRNVLDDESPLVRARAVSGISRTAEATPVLLDKLGDTSRSVRLAAARGLATRSEAIPNEAVNAEWQSYLGFNSDRPQSLFILANDAAREGRTGDVEAYLARAVSLDRVNPEMYHQSAIILSSAGLNNAASRYLYTGWELAPGNPIFPYSLGLLAAEGNNLEVAVGFLEEAVALEPRFYRAWYNLSLAYSHLNRHEDAARAMRRAEGAQ